jgi:hypothetical protein
MSISGEESKKIRKRVITKDILFAACTFPKNREETVDHYLSRITHVHLQGKRIGRIQCLESCDNLQVLYLYDNYIETIEGLSSLRGLKSLFLQNNLIKTISPISNPMLQKLRLDENEIDIVQGLENCEALEELSIAKQRIPIELRFDLNSLTVISKTLTFLDISGNLISSLAPIINLQRLEHLLCANNRITDLETLDVIRHFYYLTELNLKGNPCCKLYRYYDTVVGYASDSLRILDEAPLTAKNINSIRAVHVHRQKVVEKKIRDEESVHESGGVSAGKTLEDSNDYGRKDGGVDHWADIRF